MRRLAIQGYHDKSDGPQRLLLWIDVALKGYDQLATLHAAERVKTELLASVSHEFRTPLNVIIGYVSLLREGTYGPAAPDADPELERVLGNAAYLNELVDEFLDLSKVESRLAGDAVEPVALSGLLRELGESFAFLSRGGPVTFSLEVPEDLPRVMAQPAKLRVLVQKLLANAMRFTREGRVRLSAAAPPAGGVVIRVEDTGPGIAPDLQETIFDPFRPLGDGGRTTGVGLALARRFARVMGGDLSVESAPGAGACFTLHLPEAAADASQQAA
jgi:signal transduction histidine kinase